MAVQRPKVSFIRSSSMTSSSSTNEGMSNSDDDAVVVIAGGRVHAVGEGIAELSGTWDRQRVRLMIEVASEHP